MFCADKMTEANDNSENDERIICSVWEKIKGLLSIVAAGLLAADMFTDGMNAWEFYKMTLEKMEIILVQIYFLIVST